MTDSCLPEDLFINTKDFQLLYGADGFLYSMHKASSELFVFVNGQWEELDSVWVMMQSFHENISDNDVDNPENFSDDL